MKDPKFDYENEIEGSYHNDSEWSFGEIVTLIVIFFSLAAFLGALKALV